MSCHQTYTCTQYDDSSHTYRIPDPISRIVDNQNSEAQLSATKVVEIRTLLGPAKLETLPSLMSSFKNRIDKCELGVLVEDDGC